MRHVYGPVPSRRLGRSLGIDPVPLPGYLHDAVYTGTTWYANRSKRDRTADDFRRDFDEALSRGIAAGRLKANRPKQLPMSVGRMW